MSDLGAIGNYQLDERVTEGGMAEIFRAHKVGVHNFRREVCIKRIRPALCHDRAFVEMFIDEAHTASKLRHSNIVAIDDFGEVDGALFSCMEWVNGVDLATLLRKLARLNEPFARDAGLFVVGEVLKALEYAHGKLDAGRPLEIVHRDVTPSNVMLSYAGEVKLTDFGIARATSRLHQTHGDVVKGKTSYMAPEQARGQHLDGRVDLFALGIVAFELFAGRRPFVGERQSDVIMAIVRDERPRLSSLRADLGPEVETFIDKLLATKRDERFANATTALDALALFAPGTGPRALANLMCEHYPDKASIVRDGAALRAKVLTPVRPVAEVTVMNARMRAIPAAPPDPSLASGLIDPTAPTDRPPPTDPTDPSEAPDMADATEVDRPSVKELFTPAERNVIERARTEPQATSVSAPPAPRSAAMETAPSPVQRDIPTVTTMQRVSPETAPEPPATPPRPTADTVTTAAGAAKTARAPWVMAAAIPVVLGAVGWIALRPSARTPDATEAPPSVERPTPPPPVAPPPSVPSAPVVQPLAPAEVPATHPGATDDPHTPATLSVVVRPWGAIRIDGRPYGETRTTTRLPPGRHRIEGAQGTTTQAEVVVLRAGERRQVTITMR